jgi:catechol 2,3-dioxygenase-like lactoylglutathione lyase family enzyme
MSLTNLDVISVPVSDQERAKQFYVRQLGFTAEMDNSFGAGSSSNPGFGTQGRPITQPSPAEPPATVHADASCAGRRQPRMPMKALSLGLGAHERHFHRVLDLSVSGRSAARR